MRFTIGRTQQPCYASSTKTMANKKKESPLLGQLIQKIAPRIGASVLMDPDWNIVGQITFRNGRRSYFKYSTLDLNPLGSSEISKDKDYANFFMASMEYPTVPGSKAFYSKQWGEQIGQPDRNIDAAYLHAEKLGFPVIVKPNSGKQGVGVFLVHNKREFYKALKEIFKLDRLALVQQLVPGKDYRAVVLDDKVVAVYERIPLSVTGNGKSTIEQLIKAKQREFVASSRDTRINTSDPRIAVKLKHQKLTLKSVPAKGQRVFLLDNANLSSGGDSVDVTGQAHQDFKDMAVKLTRDMGLRLCGVDIMVDGEISEKPNKYWILEINSSPGLDHYAKIGNAQEKIVEDLYTAVLRKLESEAK